MTGGLGQKVNLSTLSREEVFQTFRLQVGNPPLQKLNFSPARSV